MALNTNIQLKRSVNNLPSTLLYGEPAWSDGNKHLYIGDSTGAPILINPLSTLSTGIIVKTATNTYLPRAIIGTANRVTVTNGDGVNANPIIDISTSYTGQSTITTLGTITTGVWNGSPLSVLYGGTGQTTASGALNALLPSQTGNSNFVLTTNGTVANWSAYTLQSAYNQSITPEILTDATRGALTIRRGSTTDTDLVLNIQNNAGTDTFTVQGNGRTYINNPAASTNFIVGSSFTIGDPNIATLPPAAYIETNTANNAGLRVYFNSGTAGTSGYFNITYDTTAPILTLVDMDDDPCFIDFSTARLGLTAPGPGTFAAPTIVNRFGGRGAVAAATTGFSWKTNGGVSGGALTEIMSCDSNFLALPSRTTVNRPSTPVNGMIGYNSTLGKLDAYENGVWTQYVDITSDQTAIAGNKTFTGKISGNTDIQQYFNSGIVSTVSNVFATITGMTITTSNTVVSKYKVSIVLAIRHSSNNNTTVEIAFFNGATQDLTYRYSQDDATIPISVVMEKIYTGVVSPTIFSVRWRRVSGTATVNVAYKSLIVQEIL